MISISLKKIKHLLINEKLRRSVGTKAMMYVKKNHDPNKVSSILERIYTSQKIFSG